jgi:hypothetical protein
MFTEEWADERGRRKDRARMRAKETKAYQRAMRPWWQRNLPLVAAIVILAAVLFIHSL